MKYQDLIKSDTLHELTITQYGIDFVFQLIEGGESVCSMVACGIFSCMTEDDVMDCPAADIGLDGTTEFDHEMTNAMVKTTIHSIEKMS